MELLSCVTTEFAELIQRCFGQLLPTITERFPVAIEPTVEVRSPPDAKWPLVVYLNGLAVKVIHESGVVQDVDTRAVLPDSDAVEAA